MFCFVLSVVFRLEVKKLLDAEFLFRVESCRIFAESGFPTESPRLSNCL